MEMGERIKRLRIERGMTQEELGKAVGLQRAAINKYEKGIVENIKRTTIIKLAEVLRTTPSYLVGYEDDEEVSELTAIQEELFEKIYELTPDNQRTLIGIVETLLTAQTRKDENDD